MAQWHALKGLSVLCLGLGTAIGTACASTARAPALSLPNSAANTAFVTGLHHLYGFNYAAAESAFHRASELNPASPLPHWGIAMALGPNTNAPQMSVEQMQQAHAAAQRALALSHAASNQTRALINAVATRYAEIAPSDRRKLDLAYSTARTSPRYSSRV
jgi:hypothetical protein